MTGRPQDPDEAMFEAVPACSTCGHPPELHTNGSGCSWSQNPLSQAASVFCKCPVYR